MTHFHCSRCRKDRLFRDISPVTRPHLTDITLSEAQRRDLLICRYCLPKGKLENVLGSRGTKVEIPDVPPGPVTEDRFLTAAQAQAQYGVKAATVHMWGARGKLAVVKDNAGVKRYRESELLQELDRYSPRGTKKMKPVSKVLQRYLNKSQHERGGITQTDIAKQAGVAFGVVTRAKRGQPLRKASRDALNTWFKQVDTEEPKRPIFRHPTASKAAPWEASKLHDLEQRVTALEDTRKKVEAWRDQWKGIAPEWEGWTELDEALS